MDLVIAAARVLWTLGRRLQAPWEREVTDPLADFEHAALLVRHGDRSHLRLVLGAVSFCLHGAVRALARGAPRMVRIVARSRTSTLVGVHVVALSASVVMTAADAAWFAIAGLGLTIVLAVSGGAGRRERRYS